MRIEIDRRAVLDSSERDLLHAIMLDAILDPDIPEHDSLVVIHDKLFLNCDCPDSSDIAVEHIPAEDR